MSSSDASDSSDVGDVEMTDANTASVAQKSLLAPGELITDDPMWMRGHGTYGGGGSRTYSSVAGSLERVNKLLRVNALHGRYIPVIGDHVIGRITEVGNRRWKVDIGSTQDAVLQLGSVNLPGGILRRKSDDDELQMREFLKEGDLLNAEVQSVFADGGAALHTRSLRYGKLRNGIFVRVPSSLVVRQRVQSHQLEGGVEVILGVNGYIWIRQDNSNKSSNNNGGGGDEGASAPSKKTATSITSLEQDSDSKEIYKDTNDFVSMATRQTISRYANCIQAFVYTETGITGDRLRAAYEASLAYSDAGSLLENAVKEQIVAELLA